MRGGAALWITSIAHSCFNVALLPKQQEPHPIGLQQDNSMGCLFISNVLPHAQFPVVMLGCD